MIATINSNANSLNDLNREHAEISPDSPNSPEYQIKHFLPLREIHYARQHPCCLFEDAPSTYLHPRTGQAKILINFNRLIAERN